jgi:hypothetical protein
VIFLLDCHVCGLQYVGESVQPFNNCKSPSILKCKRLHLRMDGLLQLCKIYHAKLRILYVLLWNTCACCNWRQHLQRLSPHGLHWPTVDEGLDTAALISVSLMLLGCRNATTGGSGNNLASVSLFSISFQKEWMDTEVTLQKRRSCSWVNTLCRRGTRWMTFFGWIYIIDHNRSWKENQRQKKELAKLV